MLDTVVINRICDGTFFLEDLPVGSRIYATHVQRDQIQATPDSERRVRLLATFESVNAEKMLSTPFIVGVAKVGEIQIDDNDGYYRAVVGGLQKGKNKELGNWCDGVIAATAYRAGMRATEWPTAALDSA